MKKTNSWMRTKVLYFIPAVAISFCAIACSDSSESDNTNEVYEKVEIMPARWDGKYDEFHEKQHEIS